MPYLLIQEDEGEPSSHELKGRVSIGRAPDNDIVLAHPSVSRRHAVVEDGPMGFILTDLGSSNGTWVGGKKVERHVLKDGEIIRFGKVQAAFVMSIEEGSTVVLAKTKEVAPPPPPLPPAQPPRPSPPPPLPPQPRPVSARRPGSTEPAPLGKRIGAALLDVVICLIPMFVGYWGLLKAPKSAKVVGWFILVLLPVAYHVLTHAFAGASLGKMALGIRVIKYPSRITAGKGIGFVPALLRTATYSLTMGLGVLPVFFRKDGVTLADLVAGTRVVVGR